MEVDNYRTMEFTVNGGDHKMFDTIGAQVTQVSHHSNQVANIKM